MDSPAFLCRADDAGDVTSCQYMFSPEFSSWSVFHAPDIKRDFAHLWGFGFCFCFVARDIAQCYSAWLTPAVLGVSPQHQEEKRIVVGFFLYFVLLWVFWSFACLVGFGFLTQGFSV